MSAPRNIDIALLRTFVAVAETGRMTGAAKVVHLTQGAVSQQIKRLERLLQQRLFDRRTDSARLTRDGEKLIMQAHRLIALNDEVVDQMRELDFTGEVRVGVAHDIVRKMMPPILRRFRQAHPNVLITLVSDTTRKLKVALRDNEIDLAVLTESERGERGQFLLTDRLMWVGATGGEAYRRRPLSIALGQEDCGFRAAAIKALAGARLPWRAICQEGSLESVFATLEADMAIAMFLSRTVPDRLEALRGRELPRLPRFHVNLRLRSNGNSPVVAEFASHIREGFESRYT
jgi:DNA-binding transcriptional LysR family regulator